MGQSPKSEFYNDDFEGMPFLQGNKTFGDKYPSFELYTTSIKKVAEKNSVLMSVRAPVGDLNIAQEDICIGRGVCGLQMKRGDNEFLYYLLKANISHLINKESGTVFGSINKNDIETFEVTLPESSEDQMKILSILRNIDKKIEVCKSLNKNLDKTIRVLYNSWFVDFLPFHNQGLKDTYMGKIPNEWEIKNLDEVCDKISDSYKPDSKEVVLIQTSDVSKGKVLNHEKVPNDDYKGHFKYKFEKNDILYTQIRPKNERYAFINFNPINYVASTQLMVLRAKPNIILPYILYLFLTSRDMIMEVNLLAESRSGTFPQINFNEIKHEKVIVAPFEVYENFWNIIKSLVEKKIIIDDEIIKLTQLRDVLLPKLMSGEIDVSKINCDIIKISIKNLNNKFTVSFQNNLIKVIS